MWLHMNIEIEHDIIWAFWIFHIQKYISACLLNWYYSHRRPILHAFVLCSYRVYVIVWWCWKYASSSFVHVVACMENATIPMMRMTFWLVRGHSAARGAHESIFSMKMFYAFLFSMKYNMNKYQFNESIMHRV